MRFLPSGSRITHYALPITKSKLYRQGAGDAKEKKSFTAKDTKDAKEKNSLTAKTQGTPRKTTALPPRREGKQYRTRVLSSQRNTLFPLLALSLRPCSLYIVP
jgi:hypothetical protein